MKAECAVLAPPLLEVLIEIPRWSFVKRGGGQVAFVSPLPCPFNYGSVPGLLGRDGDGLDALVLGPRLPAGTLVRVAAWGAVVQADRGLLDDKLVCGAARPTPRQQRLVLMFFSVYARFKALLNFWHGRPGRNRCEGWCSAEEAMGRARSCRGGACGATQPGSS